MSIAPPSEGTTKIKRKVEVKRMGIRRFINPVATACMILLTILCVSVAAQEDEGSRTVADVVLQIALHSGYTGDSPDEAADFLVANGILPEELIGDLTGPADEAFFDALQDAGIPLARCLCIAINPPGEVGNVMCWAIEVTIDAESITGQARDAYGNAANIFRVPIASEVGDFTAWCPCCEEMRAFTPQPAALGMDVVTSDISTRFLDLGLDPNSMATCLATYIPPSRPTVEPGPGPGFDQRAAGDIRFSELFEFLHLGGGNTGSPFQ
jgi:hypothetical protein